VGSVGKAEPTVIAKGSAGTIMSSSLQAASAASGSRRSRRSRSKSPYSYWFYLPAALLFLVLFIVPTVASFFFSMTRWTLFDATFIGFDNFVQFFNEPALLQSLSHTFIYATVTSSLKVVFGLALAMLLTSKLLGTALLRSIIFFPVLVSTIGVGFTFTALLNPTKGPVNGLLELLGIPGPFWLSDPALALLSVAAVDVWKGVGLAMVIFIAGIVSIPGEYIEAAKVDGAGAFSVFKNVTLPLVRPATVTVITLALIGGLKSFELIWTMTGGGPGFSSDVLASVIYKQYAAGFYGLSTAGNVVLFLIVTAVIVPISIFLNRKEES